MMATRSTVPMMVVGGNAPLRAVPGAMLWALIAGAVSATAFAPLNWWPVMVGALALLLVLLNRASTAKQARRIGWAFGYGQFAVGLNWIATAFTYQSNMPAWLGWVAILLLAVYLAIYPAMASWGAWRISRDVVPDRQPIVLILSFAALWIVMEWVRSWAFSGFSWNPLVASMPIGAVLPVVWVGSYGAAVVPIGVAGIIWLVVQRQWRLAAMLAVVGAMAQLGAVMMLSGQADMMRPNNAPLVTIVQPNINQANKWQEAERAANFAKLASLSPARAEQRGGRLLLWPEAAIPDYLEDGYSAYYYDVPPEVARQKLAALLGPNDVLLTGAVKLEIDRDGSAIGARNSLFAVNPDATLDTIRYDKAHLVPFGEYLPMRSILSRFGASRLVPGDMDFWPGPGPRTLDFGPGRMVGVQICYEIIFSGHVVDRAKRPDFIFNPSNDAWFGAWGPPQHLKQARLRALEEGLPVVRATPTGISAIIAPDGTVVQSLAQGVAGRIDASLPRADRPTLFARMGNKAGLALAAILGLLAIAFRRRRR